MPNVKPISFSANMARALLDGQKTQTRRVLKPQPPKGEYGDDYITRLNGPEWYEPAVVGKDGEIVPGKPIWGVYDDFGDFGARVPYMPGDLLWVREPWRTETFKHDKIAPAKLSGHEKIIYEADADWSLNKSVGRLRPGMFMPRWASRLTLEVTAVKVERLQEISQEDARAEGVATEEWDDWRENVTAIAMPEGSYIETERDLFRDVWNSIYGRTELCWDANPWVAAYTFTVHHMNVDDLLKRPEVLLEDADCHDNSAGSP